MGLGGGSCGTRMSFRTGNSAHLASQSDIKASGGTEGGLALALGGVATCLPAASQTYLCSSIFLCSSLNSSRASMILSACTEKAHGQQKGTPTLTVTPNEANPASCASPSGDPARWTHSFDRLDGLLAGWGSFSWSLSGYLRTGTHVSEISPAYASGPTSERSPLGCRLWTCSPQTPPLAPDRKEEPSVRAGSRQPPVCPGPALLTISRSSSRMTGSLVLSHRRSDLS